MTLLASLPLAPALSPVSPCFPFLVSSLLQAVPVRHDQTDRGDYRGLAAETRGGEGRGEGESDLTHAYIQ